MPHYFSFLSTIFRPVCNFFLNKYYSKCQPFRIQEISKSTRQCKSETWKTIIDAGIKEENLWGIQLLNQSRKNIFLDDVEYWDIVDQQWKVLPTFERFLINEQNICERPRNGIAHGFKIEFICDGKPNVGTNYKIRITYRFDFDSLGHMKILSVKAS